MRERGVLIGTTGRHGNVLKIRPPLCITADEAALIVEELDERSTPLGFDRRGRPAAGDNTPGAATPPPGSPWR